MTTYQVQWRLAMTDNWNNIEGEDYAMQVHAELRVKQYWEKLSFAKIMRFRVMEVEVKTQQ